jgi:hypothetical protein
VMRIVFSSFIANNNTARSFLTLSFRAHFSNILEYFTL